MPAISSLRCFQLIWLTTGSFCSSPATSIAFLPVEARTQSKLIQSEP
jgi:hypothetical protein